MASGNAFPPLIKRPRVCSRLSMVKRHLRNAPCIVSHLPITKRTRKPLGRMNSLFVEASSARAWGACVLDKALKAQCSRVRSRCMAQAGQLSCWAGRMGHVIEPSLVSKPILV